MAMNYIGADVDSKMTELAIYRNGKIVGRRRVPTSITAIREYLATIPGRKVLAFEEGPMAHWLYRNLRDNVVKIFVCDPRRNKLISDDGDKSDPIDAEKLALLLSGGYLREVYHSDDEKRVLLKQWVSLYHDRVRDAVRQANKIRARCLMHGVRMPGRVLKTPAYRPEWLSQIENPALANQLKLLWMSFDVVAKQVSKARWQLTVQSRPYEIIAFWREISGIGLIRAVTYFAYADTPWRFDTPNKLCRYFGVGLRRTASGTGKDGKPKPGYLRLPWAVNRYLKNVAIGAALSAIQGNGNVFRDYYQKLIRRGVKSSNARHTVARKIITVMWGMWKTTRRFEPRWV
jgi:transposase